MDRIERHLQKAVRRTPAAVRAGYEEQWRRELADARMTGVGLERISREALSTATRLKLAHSGDILFGVNGILPAVTAWVVLAAASVAAFLFGGIFGGILLLAGLGMLVVVVVVIVSSGAHTHWSHFVLIASLLTGTASALFWWWLWGVGFDAADAMQPLPAVVSLQDPALLLFLASCLAFVLSATLAVWKEHSRKATVR